MTCGAFAALSHTHIFQALSDAATAGARTRMIDILEWRAPLGKLGALVSDRLVEAHLQRFLRGRAWHLKERAESDVVK